MGCVGSKEDISHSDRLTPQQYPHSVNSRDSAVSKRSSRSFFKKRSKTIEIASHQEPLHVNFINGQNYNNEEFAQIPLNIDLDIDYNTRYDSNLAERPRRYSRDNMSRKSMEMIFRDPAELSSQPPMPSLQSSPYFARFNSYQNENPLLSFPPSKFTQQSTSLPTESFFGGTISQSGEIEQRAPSPPQSSYLLESISPRLSHISPGGIGFDATAMAPRSPRLSSPIMQAESNFELDDLSLESQNESPHSPNQYQMPAHPLPIVPRSRKSSISEPLSPPPVNLPLPPFPPEPQNTSPILSHDQKLIPLHSQENISQLSFNQISTQHNWIYDREPDFGRHSVHSSSSFSLQDHQEEDFSQYGNFDGYLDEENFGDFPVPPPPPPVQKQPKNLLQYVLFRAHHEKLERMCIAQRIQSEEEFLRKEMSEGIENQNLSAVPDVNVAESLFIPPEQTVEEEIVENEVALERKEPLQRKRSSLGRPVTPEPPKPELYFDDFGIDEFEDVDLSPPLDADSRKSIFEEFEGEFVPKGSVDLTQEVTSGNNMMNMLNTSEIWSDDKTEDSLQPWWKDDHTEFEPEEAEFETPNETKEDKFNSEYLDMLKYFSERAYDDMEFDEFEADVVVNNVSINEFANDVESDSNSLNTVGSLDNTTSFLNGAYDGPSPSPSSSDTVYLERSSSQRSKRRKAVCAFCDEKIDTTPSIGGKKPVRLLGRYWHQEHSRCGECFLSIAHLKENGFNHFAEIDGSIYCEEHYSVLKGQYSYKNFGKKQISKIESALGEIKESQTVRKVKKIFNFEKTLRLLVITADPTTTTAAPDPVAEEDLQLRRIRLRYKGGDRSSLTPEPNEYEEIESRPRRFITCWHT
ncbi:hypothetical protein HK098_003638 [Nowakowskiella sp. JEL0407]|nr:hypothetical protein HK098_003638 [Nowakowskiella sp. JEL0407]